MPSAAPRLWLFVESLPRAAGLTVAAGPLAYPGLPGRRSHRDRQHHAVQSAYQWLAAARRRAPQETHRRCQRELRQGSAPGAALEKPWEPGPVLLPATSQASPISTCLQQVPRERLSEGQGRSGGCERSPAVSPGASWLQLRLALRPGSALCSQFGFPASKVGPREHLGTHRARARHREGTQSMCVVISRAQVSALILTGRWEPRGCHLHL